MSETCPDCGCGLSCPVCDGTLAENRDATIATLTADNKRLNLWYDAWKAYHGTTHAKALGNLQQQLAALTAERDELRKQLALAKDQAESVSDMMADAMERSERLLTVAGKLRTERDELRAVVDKMGFLPTTILGRMELQLPTGQWLVIQDGRLGVARESHSSTVQWVQATEAAAKAASDS